MARTRALASCAAGVIAACLLVSCSVAPMPGPVPSQSSAPTEKPVPTGDGVFTVGTLFPASGALAYIGPAQVAGVDLAVLDINEAGGVLGKPVEVLHRDSGEAKSTTLEKSFADLVDQHVDAVVGPSSSVLAERILPAAMDAGVAMISPAATAPRLSRLDDEGYFSRTISSAALQGGVLAQLIGADEAEIAFIYFDDDTGNAMRESMEAAVDAADGRFAALEVFDASTKDLAPLLERVKKAEPDAVVLASPFLAMEQNKAIITRLTADGLGNEKLWLTSGNLADYSQALPLKSLTGVRGILEGAEPDAAFIARIKAVGKKVVNFRYAAEAYDATVLIALAATGAHDDGGKSVVGALRDTAAVGIKCMTFAECVGVLATQDDIDYDGISGPINLDGSGDPSPAHFGIYQYKADNKFYRVDGVVGG